MNKSIFLLVLLLLVTLIFPFVLAQDGTGTEVIGIIRENTTWIAENSPYELTGPTAVEIGATLMIEPGVTVNLNSYYIKVNGTLFARGNESEKIYFNDGEIRFTNVSSNWNESIAIGCIVEKTVLSSSTINVQGTSPMISRNTFNNGGISAGGWAIISNNNFVNGGISSGDSARIMNNNFTNCGISVGGFGIYNYALGYEAIISNNFVNNGEISISGGTLSGYPTVFNNTILRGNGLVSAGYAHIYNNSIYSCTDGISLRGYAVFGGSYPCYQIVENNLAVNNTNGISVHLYSRFDIGTLLPTIRENTICNNTIGVYLTQNLYNTTPAFFNNTIQDNIDYNLYLDNIPFDVNATYNWWGTTDNQTINQSIYDFKKDFTLGTVNFEPFLTEPNLNAPSIPTDIIPELSSSIILKIFLVVSLLGIVLKKFRIL